MATFYGSIATTDNLLYSFDAGNVKSYPGSGSTWFNLTNNSLYPITLYNTPTFVASQGYISFNGTNQYGYHSVPTFTTGLSSYTLEVVFRMRTLPTAEYAVNGHVYGGQNGNNLVMYISPNSKLQMVYDDSRYDTNQNSTKTLTANEWVHWTVTGYPTGQVKYWVNGVVDRNPFSITAGQEDRTFSADTYIAYDTRWVTYSTLDLSIIRKYNKVLSDTEVYRNFLAIRGRYGI